MAITTNLYPPVVQDTYPAFVRKSPCRFFFSLSSYNTAADIKNVQISLINQRNNASAFRTDLYPTGIKIVPIQYDSSTIGDYKYYVQIFPSDLVEGEFGLNQFYKIQLRFTSTAAPNEPLDGKALATWLYENRPFFSEWSKGCLLKGISRPKIFIQNFNDSNSSQEIALTTSSVDIIGRMTFEQNDDEESEYLERYRIRLYLKESEELLEDSGDIYVDQFAKNEINYRIAYNIEENIKYRFVFTYTTNNLYTETLAYNFIVLQTMTDKLKASITAEAEEDLGRVKVHLISDNLSENFLGNITIRRTSSQSNFHIWEDVKTFSYLIGAPLDFSWYDNTVKSGVWYKYCAQKRSSEGQRGIVIQTPDPVICLFDDIFLSDGERQLKIEFNPSLNEFKYNVTENQQTTIGSKYPFIRRNGANYFRSFPIGGLISALSDSSEWYDPIQGKEENLFTSKEEIYGVSKTLYEDYNANKNITKYNDSIYEREFREKVYDFLYKNNVKLFRSTTEGNILIKLMNINFQPVETLGRRLYSFTATAVEVDEPTISNYEKYKIQQVGNYQKFIVYDEERFGQIIGTFDSSNGNLIQSVLKEKYQKDAEEGYINQVKELTWFRLEINSAPYLIMDYHGQLVKYDQVANDPNVKISDATSGYILSINGVQTIVRPSMQRNNSTASSLAFFEVDKGSSITDLKFKYPTAATIDYTVIIEKMEDTSHSTKSVYYYAKPGQLQGVFESHVSLMKKLKDKYDLDYEKYYQRLLDVTGIKIEAPVGTVIFVQDSEDEPASRHVLENGYLQLVDKEITIKDFWIDGVHLTESTTPLEVNGISREDLTLQPGTYESLSEITNPVNGGIYQLQTVGVTTSLSLGADEVLIITEEGIQKISASTDPDAYYALLLDRIDDDEKLKFIYYYGNWYSLPKGCEAAGLLKHDIRTIRETEYVLMYDKTYTSTDEIENPITNGVYRVGEGNIKMPYIYYHNKWYFFNEALQTVVCPVNGIIDYYCELMKGVY